MHRMHSSLPIRFSQAIVRKPCPDIVNAITSSPELGQPIYEVALEQHDKYVNTLKKCDVDVTILPPLPGFPDSTFVEDTAVMIPGGRVSAILCRPGVGSRVQEIEYMKPTLQRICESSGGNLYSIQTPGTLEGGDVLLAGTHYFVGISERTNVHGASQFGKILEIHNQNHDTEYTISCHTLQEMLHLKTGITYIENGNWLVAGEFSPGGLSDFSKFIESGNIYSVDSQESYAANSLYINGNVLVPENHPEISSKIRDMNGKECLTVATSEFRKCDGGLSCLSLRFGGSSPTPIAGLNTKLLQSFHPNSILRRNYSTSLRRHSHATAELECPLTGKNKEEEEQEEELKQVPLSFKKLPYESVEVTIPKEEHRYDDFLTGPSVFLADLERSVEILKRKGVQALYVKLATEYGHLTRVCSELGFQYYCAEGNDAFMLKWLPDSQCLVPHHGTHNVGVGAVLLAFGTTRELNAKRDISVVSEEEEQQKGKQHILLVKEKRSIYSDWKLPGGYLNLGEDIGQGASREVLEETGIVGKFQGILALRHTHNIQRDRSDIYIMVKMSLHDVPDIVTCSQEINDAAFLPLDDFRKSSTHPLMQEVLNKLEITGDGLTEKILPSVIKGRNPFKMYTLDDGKTHSGSP